MEKLAFEKGGDPSIKRDLVNGYIKNGDAKGNLYGASLEVKQPAQRTATARLLNTGKNGCEVILLTSKIVGIWCRPIYRSVKRHDTGRRGRMGSERVCGRGDWLAPRFDVQPRRPGLFPDHGNFVRSGARFRRARQFVGAQGRHCERRVCPEDFSRKKSGRPVVPPKITSFEKRQQITVGVNWGVTLACHDRRISPSKAPALYH
jgi:hypothetical protein